MYGPVCTVVWEGRNREAPPYPDWKKVQRNELTKEEALLAARLLERSDIEFIPARSLLEAAAEMAIDLGHPAYDCLYLAMAVANDCVFVTADESFLRKLLQHLALGGSGKYFKRAVSLNEAADAINL